MTALIAVLTAQGDPTTLNESGLLDSFVMLLLADDEPNDPLDPRRREHLLGFLAASLTRQGTNRIARLDAEEQLGTRFRQLGWGTSMSAGQVLDSLIRRRVLVQDDDGVGFRHAAMADLFAAKGMNDDRAFAEELLEDPLRHAPAIRHAAGLDRNKRGLLEAAASVAAGVFDRVEDVTVQMFDSIKERPGWSEDVPDLDRLRSTLATGDPQVDEETLDEMYEDVTSPTRRTDPLPELPASLVDLSPAVGLLSHVLRNSELVDDVALKTAELKRALHGWALLTVVFAVREDQSQAMHGLLREALGAASEAPDEQEVDGVEQIAATLTTSMVTAFVGSTLGSAQLEGVLREVLRDREFMQETAHATLATMLAYRIGLRGWPGLIKELYEHHGEHPVVAQLALSVALSAYRSPDTGDAVAGELESFLADSYSANSGSGSARVVQRNAVLNELQTSRRAARWRRQESTEITSGGGEVIELEDGM